MFFEKNRNAGKIEHTPSEKGMIYKFRLKYGFKIINSKRKF